MSKGKYPSIFSPQMEAIVFIIHQIVYATRAVLKIGEYPRIFPSFIWGIFAHVTRFDQSRASENICWIIMVNMNASTVTFIEIWRYCPCFFNMLTSTTLNRSAWGGGVLPEKWGRGVWFASENPHPIYDQNVRYSLPYLWPEQKFETLFRPVSVVRYNTSLVQTNVKLL